MKGRRARTNNEHDVVSRTTCYLRASGNSLQQCIFHQSTVITSHPTGNTHFAFRMQNSLSFSILCFCVAAPHSTRTHTLAHKQIFCSFHLKRGNRATLAFYRIRIANNKKWKEKNIELKRRRQRQSSVLNAKSRGRKRVKRFTFPMAERHNRNEMNK